MLKERQSQGVPCLKNFPARAAPSIVALKRQEVDGRNLEPLESQWLNSPRVLWSTSHSDENQRGPEEASLFLLKEVFWA